ncbi:MAG: hypothetical protein QF552_12815 [Litorilituus sp.]|jgi:hypothetical protein|nr:hypothetical protein [Litorilituus sp.]
MNQRIVFNDDYTFDTQQELWRSTALISGEIITIYFHSILLKKMKGINTCTKFDLEELVEFWLEKNELQGNKIHIP